LGRLEVVIIVWQWCGGSCSHLILVSALSRKVNADLWWTQSHLLLDLELRIISLTKLSF
jgi:hypothetical protein